MNKAQLVWEAGQHFTTGFAGTKLDEAFRETMRRWKIGNVILFSRNLVDADQIASLCQEITSLVKAETGTIPWIMIDQEGGMISRLPASCPVAPSAMALSALGDEEAARRCANETARVLRNLGINFNLAPVLDVNTNVKNPVIGCRSYGATPQSVERMAKWAIRGYMEGGVLCCGKHFPGHGDTSLDSHLSLPVVNKTREELRGQLEPFREAIREGIPSIMSSHILFPAFEKEKIPCTMSRAIITDLLRGEFGFDGLVLSDCMEMQAIAKYYGTVKGCASAIRAGVDIVLVSHTASLAAEAEENVVSLYEKGYFDEEAWSASVKRNELWKRKMEGSVASSPSPDARSVLDSYAAKAITLVSGKVPPLADNPVFIAPPAYLTARIQDTCGGENYARAMASRLGGEAIVISGDPTEEERRRVTESVRGRKCYLGTYNAHLQTGQLRLAEELLDAGVPLVVTALRNPYDLAGLRGRTTTIAAWEYSSRIFDALAALYQGKGETGGTLPVPLE